MQVYKHVNLIMFQKTLCVHWLQVFLNLSCKNGSFITCSFVNISSVNASIVTVMCTILSAGNFNIGTYAPMSISVLNGCVTTCSMTNACRQYIKCNNLTVVHSDNQFQVNQVMNNTNDNLIQFNNISGNAFYIGQSGHSILHPVLVMRLYT